MTDTLDPREASDDQPWFPIARRNLLRAAGASAVLLGMGAGTAVAQSDEDEDDGDDSSSDDGTGDDDSQMNGLDPIFGLPSAEPNPCIGDAGEECFDEFDVKPSHEVEVHIDLPEELLPFTAPGVLDQATIENINAAIADGQLDADELDDPEMEVTAQTPDGELTLTVEEIATALVGKLAFHFEPTGLNVEPGDVVLFSAETPDHGFTVFHERHGRQNRVPDGVGPISSPIIPVGGYWLYQFQTEGVYDAYCPPHEPFGMVMRVVVGDGSMPEDDSTDDGTDVDSESNGDTGDDMDDGDSTDDGDDMDDGTDDGDDMDDGTDDGSDGTEEVDTGRPPIEVNLLSAFFGGIDLNLPSSAAVFESSLLSSENIVSEGTVSWDDVVEAYRSGGA